MGYDFSRLNDKEFEILVADLLSAHFGNRIERFKPGKDSGVDGRFYSDIDKEIILQCKHYLGTGYSGLISKLKNVEVKKVTELTPERYIFATSLPLSRENKKEIREIFNPFIKRADDIFGQEDLNDILSLNSNIEEKYFKLWITSTAVLKRILNNAIIGRSQSELERIQENAHKYVHTNNHEKALEILGKKHVVIISGEPGIGKTTLAENLALLYSSKGFEFVDIQESLSEAEDVYNPEAKQIFYFDDFLGSNYFEIIKNKKDSHIIKFIERIKRDKTKRFILTSRTNIFNSGRLHSPVFSNYKIEKQEYLITIDTLSELDRAKILYNHIWYSKLHEDFIDQIYINKRYKNIIRHKNFNPRLIEFITDVDRIPISSNDEYWEYITKTLENPVDVWEDCFKRQNNSFVRNLVNLTVFNGGEIDEEDLKRSYLILNKSQDMRNSSHTAKDFRSMSQLAVKSFLNRNKIYKNTEYELFNPSIADYVLKEYSSELEELKLILKSLNSVKSLNKLITLERGDIISKRDVSKLKQYLFEDAIARKKNYDYRIYISHLVKDIQVNHRSIIELIYEIVFDPLAINELAKFMHLLIDFKDDLNFDDFNFLVDITTYSDLNESEIKAFGNLIDVFEIKDDLILEHYRGKVEDFIREELANIKSDVDISNYFKTDRYYNGYMESEQDEDGVKIELYDMICQILKDMKSNTIESLDLDLTDLINEVDIDQLFQNFYESKRNLIDEGKGFPMPWKSLDKDIDDLFERT